MRTIKFNPKRLALGITYALRTTDDKFLSVEIIRNDLKMKDGLGMVGIITNPEGLQDAQTFDKDGFLSEGICMVEMPIAFIKDNTPVYVGDVVLTAGGHTHVVLSSVSYPAPLNDFWRNCSLEKEVEVEDQICDCPACTIRRKIDNGEAPTLAELMEAFVKAAKA